MKKPLEILGLSMLSLVLTVGFFVLAALPVRRMERKFGFRWTALVHGVLVGAFIAVGQLEYAWVLAGLLVLVLSYSFFESQLELKQRFWSGALAVASSAGVSVLLLGVWGMTQGPGYLSVLLGGFRDRWIELSATLGQSSQGLTADQVVTLLPGILLSSLIAALVLALVVDRPQPGAGSSTSSLPFWFSFSVPDVFVWLTIPLLLGGFYPYEGMDGLRVISQNGLLTLAFVYFVQGMVVVTAFLRHWKVPFAMRALFYVLLFFNFYIVTIVGFSDYWLEYRQRFLLKTKKEMKNRGESS